MKRLPPLPTPLRAGLACLLGLLAGAASAAGAPCSRTISAPVAPTGASVIIEAGNVSGIYPDLLRSIGPRNGCTIVFPIVPRARQVAMFEAGKADMLVPATRTAARDQIGIFVPMMGHRATLISLASDRPPITSAKELLERRELRVAVVRGFDHGEQYTALVKELARQGRLFTEVDVSAVARLLNMGAVDMTIMGPTILAGAIAHEPRVSGMLDKLRLEPIPELPWGQSGAYISRLSLTPEDQQALRELLEQAAKSGAVMEGFKRYHRPDILAASVRAH
ncbi:transporter substrate-binding domain-containing protein [Duganella sp. FT3S]|uniref:Transporter substrate-binding domain-containing protein n=1 Tax=Rugamonas fusca TaxID=2758568 RepID=A0A7W2I9F8_9BURK|nr:transporter substrate-binding domain-containing protein [Rugamonas fusca]MBA5608672.1 transporter substrate-binding domain-containing protein [Rugamonas fusca]